MRILCFVPLHPDYGIKPESLASIMALEHDDQLDIMFAAHDNPHAGAYENVVHQHNKARIMVLEGVYDALLSIEADMIVPPDTIAGLIDCDADISYGLYVWRHNQKRWSAYKDLNLWGGHSVSHNHAGEEARAAWGNIIDVAGLGMGCTLISREVLQAIPFRLHDGTQTWIEKEYASEMAKLGINPKRPRTGMVCDDWLLAMDAQHHGYSQRCNLGVVCGHITDDGVLWPDPTVQALYRMEPV